MARFGVFSVAGAEPRVGWRAGDEAVLRAHAGRLELGEVRRRVVAST